MYLNQTEHVRQLYNHKMHNLEIEKFIAEKMVKEATDPDHKKMQILILNSILNQMDNLHRILMSRHAA